MTTTISETRRSRVPAVLIIGIVFVGAQFAMIGVGLFGDLRYFTWAPHDQQARFMIEATVDGVDLTSEEVHARYGRSSGVDPRAISHVLNIVRQRETTYGADDDATVLVRYWVNGKEEEQWHWPPN